MSVFLYSIAFFKYTTNPPCFPLFLSNFLPRQYFRCPIPNFFSEFSIVDKLTLLYILEIVIPFFPISDLLAASLCQYFQYYLPFAISKR